MIKLARSLLLTANLYITSNIYKFLDKLYRLWVFFLLRC
jgi:hypothetical protein